MVCAALPLTMLAAREKSDRLCLIIEYDARTVNLGLVASVWRNHFEAMFELQNFRWINFGLRY